MEIVLLVIIIAGLASALFRLDRIDRLVRNHLEGFIAYAPTIPPPQEVLSSETALWESANPGIPVTSGWRNPQQRAAAYERTHEEKLRREAKLAQAE